MATKINFTQQQINQIIQYHNEGRLNREIAEFFNVSKSTIARVLQSNNVPSRHPWLTLERKNKVVELYTTGLTKDEISKELHMSDSTISDILRECDIDIRTMSETKMKYKLNREYFDQVDSQNKAYILGLLYADGNVGKNNNVIQISLAENDVHILKSILTELESDYPLTFIPYNSKNENWQNQFSLHITNKYMHDSLIEKGLVPNKSLILKYPDFLSDDLHRHFIRGYLDGDGHISKSEKRISIVGTETFCCTVADILGRVLNIHCSISSRKGKENVSTRTLGIAGGNQTKRFLDWIYTDSNLFLHRKYVVYKEKYCCA